MNCFFPRTLFLCAYILFLCVKSYSLSNFSNYQSVIRVNDILVSGTKVWAASSGGLLYIDLEKHTQTFFSNSTSFPDLNLTALAADSKGNIWIGSNSGYLYKRAPDGRITTFNSYYGVQWNIQAVFVYKDFVIVGASKGLGIFDPNKGISIRNTEAMDTTGNPSVNVIAVHNDSLYAGCNASFDAFDISGSKFLNSNYLDLTLWNATYTASPVVSFSDSSGTFMPRYSPSFFVGRTLFHCDDVVDSVSFSAADGSETFYNATAIRAGTAPAFKVPGAVTMMTTDEKNNVWVGTDQNFLYCWNGTALTQYSIGGPTFNYFNRVYAAKNGIVWMLPQAQDTKFNPPWWEGITSFNGKQWHLFNRFSVKGMGLFGDGGPDFRGICEDRNGNMWFGTSGTSVKMYNGSKNLWSYFYFAGYEVDSVRQDPQGGHFGKHDAIVQDSSGYLWVANHIMTTKIINGCLICYDPSRSNSPDYRRFFPLNSTYSFGDLRSLCVDSRGKILVGGGNDGRLLVLSHDGHPLQNGVNVVVDKSDMGTISGMCATSNGNTWIAAGSGLYNYTSGADSISLILKTPVNCVAAETDSIIWLGTFGSGLIRYDVGKDSTKTVDIVSGLASNSINDISIDKTNGYLWVATAAGLSRYSLGHSSTPIVGNAEIIAFPNPFSLSNPNHREIVFKHCAAGAKVLIYAFNGALVKQLAPGIDNAYSSGENPFETTLHWVPSKKMSPGTYYFIGQSQKPTKTKKLLIVP